MWGWNVQVQKYKYLLILATDQIAPQIHKCYLVLLITDRSLIKQESKARQQEETIKVAATWALLIYR